MSTVENDVLADHEVSEKDIEKASRSIKAMSHIKVEDLMYSWWERI